MHLSRLKELYRYRGLIWNLVVRELKARYRGSTLGFLWSFLNPFLLASVYTFVFSVNLRFGMNNTYVPYLLSGLLPWLWFNSAMLEGSGSILGGGNLIKKVLFPAEVLPLVVVLSNAINFLLSLPVLLPIIIFFRIQMDDWSFLLFARSMLALPIVVLVQLAFTFGLALIFSSVCVRYRDIQHLLGNLLTFWFFLTPIIYPLENIKSEQIRALMKLNPVTLIVLSYEDIFYYGRFPNFAYILIVAILSIIMYIAGSMVFEKYRGTFAEEV